jgi:hypothetical protein
VLKLLIFRQSPVHEMKRPNTFTITTFWMDWLLQPIVLAAVRLTVCH